MLKFQALGAVFVALLVVAVWAVYGVFTQKFSHYDKVTLDTDTIGLQLPYQADVKIRGVEVGEVLNYAALPGGKGATVTLGIDPSKIGIIPANVTGAILPKTLFGEKYVSLEIPSDPSKASLQPGSTITRTAVSTEVEKLLSDIYPLLTTIQPAQLNETLNALATALEGRGAELGQTIETTAAYLKKLDPQIPALVSDLKETSKVAQNYTDVLPEIAGILRNALTTTTTLQARQQQLHQLFSDVDSFSSVANSFLERNGNTLIQLGQVSAPVLSVLARYSTEFPCLLGGLDNFQPRVAQAFRGYTLHIVLETLPRQPRQYTPADKPVNGDNRGPACAHLPNPPWSQANPLKAVPNLNDGVNTPTGKGTDRAATSYGTYSTPMAYADGPAEAGALDELLAPGLGVAPQDVPQLGALLAGPIAAGAKVSLR